MHRRSFGKSADELIEEFFGADLKVEGVAAVLDANVKELASCKLWLCSHELQTYVERK
jgi:hypothetical protein